jgi:hypothetical protein
VVRVRVDGVTVALATAPADQIDLMDGGRGHALKIERVLVDGSMKEAGVHRRVGASRHHR